MINVTKSTRGRRGVAVIWVALTMLMFVAFVGLAIDTGYVAWVGEQLQIGADGSALAAAAHAKLTPDEGRTAAVNLALLNEVVRDPILLRLNDANDPEGDIVYGRYNRELRLFDPLSPAVNAVKVVARRTDTSLGGPLPLLFGPIFGVDTVNTERMAIAMASGGTGAGLIALADTGECTLVISGSATTVVSGAEDDITGAIQVNSDDPCAICFSGAITVNTDEINVVGGICITGGASDLPPEQNEGVEPIPDPLAFLEDPRWDCVDPTDLGTVSMQGGEIVTIGPGYYSGGLSINNGELTLLPGIYVLDGAGLDVTGSANFFAEGVMFYIIGTGAVDLTGTGQVLITPPDPELYTYPCVEEYEGVAIFQARDNTNESNITGTGNMNLSGSLYFPTAHVNISGDSVQLGNQFIAWTIQISGNGTVSIDYDGRFPAPGGKVYLVE